MRSFFTMHPANKCSHQENRTKVCCHCGKKIVFQKIDPKKFLITTHIENLIKKFISDEFDSSDERFPLSICRTCYLTLLDAEKGVLKRPMPPLPNYKDIDALNDPKIYEKVGLFKIVPYISSFKAMNKIVHCCFTSNKVGPSLECHLTEFENAMKSIENISQTLKIHIVLEHVKQSLQFIDGNNGLGLWSEQSGESVHREFLSTWKRHSINVIKDESYLPRLLKAVTEFSSLKI